MCAQKQSTQNPTESAEQAKPPRLSGSRYVPLDDQQKAALVRLCSEPRKGEICNFAEAVSKFGSIDIASAKKNLRRMQDPRSLITWNMFDLYARALKMTRQELFAHITQTPATANPFMQSVPWITDEAVLCKYRRLFHRYHQTRQAREIFWIHTTIDFSRPRTGCLHASHRMGLTEDDSYEVEAYGYLFRQMLMTVGTNDEEGFENESVFLFPDFRKKSLNGIGHFGVLLNEDWNTDVGFGGCFIIESPLSEAISFGRQNKGACKALDERWKMLGKNSCDRLLHLFSNATQSRVHSDRRRAAMSNRTKSER